jgi:hypothetical protein
MVIEESHLIPPDMSRQGFLETEIWQLLDAGKVLQIDRRIHFSIAGVSIQDKHAVELYKRLEPGAE